MAASNPQERSPCVPDRTFEQLFSGAKLPENQLAELDRHADECEECAERLADFGFRRGAQVRAAAGGSAVKRGPLEAGAVFDGRYRVEALLGSGGMGTIVRARDLKKNVEVALKLMRPERIGDATALVRFLREARATMSLDSPNAVRILDVGRTEQDAPYLVMESLRGRDLARLVAANGPLSPERAIDYTLQALNAISEAHARGIVHRDLKPQNIFVTDDEVVKVLDFGLAKLLPTPQEPHAGPESHATRTNVLLGSPRYMSPEQIATPRDIDARADLWSMGAAMFHMLTGRPPFLEKNLLVLATKIFSENAPRVSALRPDVPAALDAVIARCMQRDRNRRFRDGAAMAAELREVMHVSAPAVLPVLGTRAISERKVNAAVALAGTLDSDSYEAPTQLHEKAAQFHENDAELPKLYTTSVEVVPSEHEMPNFREQSDDAELTVRMDISVEANLVGSLPRMYDEDDDRSLPGGSGTVVIASDAFAPSPPQTAPLLEPNASSVPPAARAPAGTRTAPPLLNTVALHRYDLGVPEPKPTGGPPIPPFIPPFRDLQESFTSKPSRPPSRPMPRIAILLAVVVVLALAAYTVMRLLRAST